MAKNTLNLTIEHFCSNEKTKKSTITNNIQPLAAAKPFLKWAGGKTQLLKEFDNRYPDGLGTSKINKYVEPFVGGGAVLFHVIQNFHFDEICIYDANEELILAYNVVKNEVDKLIDILKTLENEFLCMDTEARKEYYYRIRDKFNENKSKIDFSKFSNDWTHRAAHLIFLNRTCFNGLYRVNSKGKFNVPIGSYKNPKIAIEDVLRNASSALKNVQINLGDFTTCESIVDDKTFVYFDPPYRPLSKTSHFTSYHKDVFDDSEQQRLSQFYKKLDGKGAKLMISNSDPKNEDKNDNFFDELYSDFTIDRVLAKRIINSKSSGRGEIYELIIMNYDVVKSN